MPLCSACLKLANTYQLWHLYCTTLPCPFLVHGLANCNTLIPSWPPTGIFIASALLLDPIRPFSAGLRCSVHKTSSASTTRGNQPTSLSIISPTGAKRKGVEAMPPLFVIPCLRCSSSHHRYNAATPKHERFKNVSGTIVPAMWKRKAVRPVPCWDVDFALWPSHVQLSEIFHRLSKHAQRFS